MNKNYGTGWLRVTDTLKKENDRLINHQLKANVDSWQLLKRHLSHKDKELLLLKIHDSNLRVADFKRVCIPGTSPTPKPGSYK